VKPPVTAAAVTAASFSDRTCLETTGVDWRYAKRFCRANNVPIAKIGRRSVVSVGAWLAALERSTGAEPAAAIDLDAFIKRAAGAR
jgi:hypothetical protein